MTIFVPEQKALKFLKLLRNGQSGIGEQICTEICTLTTEQLMETVDELKVQGIHLKPEFDVNRRVVGMTIPIADNLSMYVVTPPPVVV